MRRRKPKAVDLFCGIGGMSLGVRQAGFDVVAAFDLEERHVRGYKKNFRQSRAFVQDISSLTSAKINSITGLDEVDFLFGGPPCQGFSVGGLRLQEDSRNQLLLEFARLVGELRPKYFLLENVAGLTQGYGREFLAEFIKRVESQGFHVGNNFNVLDAAEFGVPQKRKRLFVLGTKSGLPPLEIPSANHITTKDGEMYFPTVGDAIRDLPKVDSVDHLLNEDGFHGEMACTSYYSSLMQGFEKEAEDKLRQRKRCSPLTGCLRTAHSLEVQRRFRETEPGKSESISRYKKLEWQGLAPTIRAGTGPDRGSHTSPRPIHPEHPRCITVREAARLHSFPDWFQFDPTRWHAFRQIGNSVPPRLAWSIASPIYKGLTEYGK